MNQLQKIYLIFFGLFITLNNSLYCMELQNAQTVVPESQIKAMITVQDKISDFTTGFQGPSPNARIRIHGANPEDYLEIDCFEGKHQWNDKVAKHFDALIHQQNLQNLYSATALTKAKQKYIEQRMQTVWRGNNCLQSVFIGTLIALPIGLYFINNTGNALESYLPNIDFNLTPNQRLGLALAGSGVALIGSIRKLLRDLRD